MKTSRIAGAVIGACVAVGGCAHEVRPDDMSAEAHRAAAQKEWREAQLQMANAVNDSPGRDPSSTGIMPEIYTDPDANSNLAYDPRVQATLLKKRAREHEQAAAVLESFEETECRTVPPAERTVCPSLHRVTKERDIEGGVRLRVSDPASSDDVVIGIRCHYAFARDHGFPDHATCPLSIRGIEIRKTSASDAVDVVGKDARTTAEIRKRVDDEIREGVATGAP
jgi:hypothetical protein